MTQFSTQFSNSSPSTSPPIAPVPSHGRETVAAITAAFAECERETARLSPAGVSVPLFLRACASTVNLYAHVFSPGSFLARVLGRTTTRHIGCVAAAQALRDGGAADGGAHARQGGGSGGGGGATARPPSLRALLVWERDRGGPAAVRADRTSACHTAMWLSRGLRFCETFMELLADGRDAGGEPMGPRVCATAAYQRTLEPFHGLLLATVFRAAMSYAPAERTYLFRTFGYDDIQEGEARVRECVAAMRPVTRRVHNIIVEEGIDFPDKVSPLRGALR